MAVVRSYTAGRWFAPDTGAPVYDTATGQLLRKHREELYELSYRTGATLYDSKFDIDGGIGVLLSYASKAKRELPNDHVVVEGPPEQFGKAGQFLGQHLL